MKNILLLLFLCLSVSNYGQSTSVKINAKKETNANPLTNIFPDKDDSFFDQTLISLNPIKRQLNIEKGILDRIIVYDTLGQLQKKFVFLNNSEYHTIDLSELSKGIYFVVLENNNRTAKRKIIIDQNW